MRIVVLGSGVLGVATAWYLSRDGHEVTVIDRQPGPALETSFANAGEISPGYSSPWAAPGIPQKALRWMFMRHAPLILRPRPDPWLLRWTAAFLRNCTAENYAVNKDRMVRVAEYSRACLEALRNDLGLDYDQEMLGTLQLFRTRQQLDAVGKDVEVLRQRGVAFELLDRQGCIAVEPGLAAATDPIAGGLRLPGDETGDCHKFTVALADHCRRQGVKFLFGTRIQALAGSRAGIDAVICDRGQMRADAYVVALGSWSAPLLRPLGIDLPVQPVKGYSLTFPVGRPDQAPRSTLLDESYKVAITRLGDRIRVGGLAELAGYGMDLPARRRQTLEHSVLSLFPQAGDARRADFWAGLRPMTPDGPPVIGRTPVPRLLINSGHGTLGWTMACGSSRIIADIVSGRRPEIETADLSIARYGS